MHAFALPLVIYYFLVITVVCIYGLHRYWIVWVFYRTRPRPRNNSGSQQGTAEANATFDELPVVTVQLPMFNEKRVAERIIEAVCRLDYPSDRLQIQVLDDSTDDSALIAQQCCERLAAQGHDIDFIHRDDRGGYKAGALDHAMDDARGEFIMLFDADFVPPPDMLKRIIHDFTDERIGMVQARWAHLNRDESMLTRIQAMYLDGHFIIEQAARSASGKWFNFNGTAGIWRRSCIEDAGGWQHDTLTEDADLSYRAQLKGWTFKYRNDVTCPAEIPPTINAFLSQQHRWNKGLIQTAIKLLPRILKSDAPLGTKIESWFHLTSPIVHLAILLLVTLVVPSLFMTLPLENVDRFYGLLYGGVFLGLGAMAACTFYIASQSAQGKPIFGTLWHLPVLLAIGIGITILNTKAIGEAVIGKKTPFVRTPKYNGEATSELDPLAEKKARRLPPGSLELALGLIMSVCFFIAIMRPFTMVGAPFILLFASGFLTIGIASLRAHLRQAAIDAGAAALANTTVTT